MNAKKVLGVMVGVVVVLAALSANAGVITSGLVSWWKFEEGSGTWADDAQSATHALPADANDGTLTNGPIWSSSVPTPPPSGKVTVSTWSLSFDGSNDYVSVPAAASLGLTEYSLEAWVHPNTTTPGTIVQKVDSTGGWHNYIIGASGSTWQVSSDGVCSATGGTVVANKWYHIVGTYKAGTGMYMYVQQLGGSLVTGSASSSATPHAGANTLYIGSNQGLSGYSFNGLIDDVRIYNRALTSAEVIQNYDAMFTTETIIPEPASLGLIGMALLALRRRRRFTIGAKRVLGLIVGVIIMLAAVSANAGVVVDNNLISWWKLDEANGPPKPAADDCRPADNNGTYGGDPEQVAAKDVGSSYAQYFDGNDNVVVPDNNSLDITGALTVEAWAKTPVVGTENDYSGLVSKGTAYELIWYRHSTFGAGRLVFYLNNAVAYARYDTNLATATWYHVVATYDPSLLDGKNMKIYVDGVLKTWSSYTTAVAANASSLTIGQSAQGGTGGRYFNGTIDDVRIYNRALTAAEVTQNYNAMSESGTIPEPASLGLIGMALLALRRRRQ